MFGMNENRCDLSKTVISREYNSEWRPGNEPYYPVNDGKNSLFYAQYKTVTDKEENIIFGRHLSEYKYYDMDQVIAAAQNTVQKLKLFYCVECSNVK